MTPKFRAWHKKKKKMYEVNALYLDVGYIQIREGNKAEWLFADDFVLMQSTELKDKNGKEIFEGDIVIDHEISLSLNNKRIIKNFIEDSFWLHNGIMDYENRMGEPGNKIFEVIGNIYENKELMKE